MQCDTLTTCSMEIGAHISLISCNEFSMVLECHIGLALHSLMTFINRLEITDVVPKNALKILNKIHSHYENQHSLRLYLHMNSSQ